MGEVETEENERALLENCQSSEVTKHMRVGGDRRRYNIPTFDEVAAVFVRNDGVPPVARYIVIYPRNRPLHDKFQQ